jgi:DNA (cytosine-5)-methyltransferase 1
MELFPTLKARDAIPEGYESGLRRSSPQVGTIVKGLVNGDDRVLFRTPTTTNATAGAVSESAAIERGTTVKTQDQIAELAFHNGLKVPNSIVEQLTLIPTTRVSMAKGATAKEVAEGNPKSRIEAEVLLGETNWGKFSAAIDRWERVIGRKAPAPTKADGKDGSHRLSSLFTEWLMGLPVGWITGHNLSRAEELKMAGNGVVPQQAEMALRFLIDDKNFK